MGAMEQLSTSNLAAATRYWREARSLTLAKVGFELGVRRQVVHEWEAKGRPIPLARLDALARALGVPLDFLLRPPPGAP